MNKNFLVSLLRLQTDIVLCYFSALLLLLSFFKLFFLALFFSFSHLRAFLFSISLNRFMLFICFQCFLPPLSHSSILMQRSSRPTFSLLSLPAKQIVYSMQQIWFAEHVKPQVASNRLFFLPPNNANQFQFLSIFGFSLYTFSKSTRICHWGTQNTPPFCNLIRWR